MTSSRPTVDPSSWLWLEAAPANEDTPNHGVSNPARDRRRPRTPIAARCRLASWPRRSTSRRNCWRKCCSVSCDSSLLESHQGIRGGYGLARAAATVSVADIIQAIDGPLTVTACSVEDHSCDQYAKCNIRDPLWQIKDRIVSALAATSVADLAMDLASAPPAGAVPVAVVRK